MFDFHSTFLNGKLDSDEKFSWSNPKDMKNQTNETMSASYSNQFMVETSWEENGTHLQSGSPT